MPAPNAGNIGEKFETGDRNRRRCAMAAALCFEHPAQACSPMFSSAHQRRTHSPLFEPRSAAGVLRKQLRLLGYTLDHLRVAA
jgi:hypothetical protein